MWHSLQSKPKKSGEGEEEQAKEKDAKKKSKGNEGGFRKPEEPSKDKEGDDSKDGEEEAGDKQEEQDGDSQGEEERGVEEESADKHQVHSYVADGLRCLEAVSCTALLKSLLLLLLHTTQCIVTSSARQFSSHLQRLMLPVCKSRTHRKVRAGHFYTAPAGSPGMHD